MASRRLSDLHPDVAHLAQQFLSKCEMAGIHVMVTCTYRSEEEQQALYDQGRTKPGNIVTNAKPGESLHNCKYPLGTPASRAFDVVPIVNGKPVWDGTDPVWDQIGMIGIGIGLEWAGEWTVEREHFVEKPHFQLKAS